MSSRRAILCLVVLVSVAALAIDAADLIVGAPGPRDVLAGREVFKKDSKILQIVTADRTFNSLRGETISQVKLLDQNRKGQGATATITAGGPGAKFVTVHFKSKRGESIDFIAELWGH